MRSIQEIRGDMDTIRTALFVEDQAVRARANQEYDELVREAIETLGEDAHCADVDPVLWNEFSDAYKDRRNFRPRGHFSRADIQRALPLLYDEPLEEDNEDYADRVR